MTTPALGYIPPMTKGITDDPDYIIPLLEMLEEEEVESIWTVEHVVMADQYEPLYPYSADGRAPTAPDTLMPDPLEWLAFAAARTEKIRLGTAVVIASQHSAAILAKRVATLDAVPKGASVSASESAGSAKSTRPSACRTVTGVAGSMRPSKRCGRSGADRATYRFDTRTSRRCTWTRSPRTARTSRS